MWRCEVHRGGNDVAFRMRTTSAGSFSMYDQTSGEGLTQDGDYVGTGMADDGTSHQCAVGNSSILYSIHSRFSLHSHHHVILQYAENTVVCGYRTWY